MIAPTTTKSSQSTSVDAIRLYHHLLVALDSSEYANHGLQQAVELARMTPGARLTGIHVYAAQLHDNRFRQMEGGLPEQFRKEEVLEEQRDVHDSLITHGLDLITQSYLDVGQHACAKVAINYDRLAPEGKNYRQLARATQSGQHDLLVMGVQGVGAVPGESIGSVCERVIRRTAIDTLVVKNPATAIAKGPIVVAIDGSALAYGGMLTALALGQLRGLPVILAAAYDPYYHYVVFNNISKVLSKEGAEVFRFEEQEKLHEEIIDSGLAKIYQTHLDVGKTIAADYGVAVETILLVGKPAVSVAKLLMERGASLLVVGKTGVHADAELDIGHVTEVLVRQANCDVLVSLRPHTPEVDRVADFTTSWSEEAEKRLERVPTFARKMARMAILRYAQEKGHTVITERLVEEASAELMPAHATRNMEQIVRHMDAHKEKKPFKLVWHPAATAMLKGLADHSMRANVRLRAEKAARQTKSQQVLPTHVAPFMEQEQSNVTKTQEAIVQQDQDEPVWTAEARARLQRVPEGFMRNATHKSVLAFAKQNGQQKITLEVAEKGISRARKHMVAKMAKEREEHPSFMLTKVPKTDAASNISWTVAAETVLARIPEGISRTMSRNAIATIASRKGLQQVDEDFVSSILDVFKDAASTVSETMAWDADARAMLAHIPLAVRGMLVKEIEGWVDREGLSKVATNSVIKIFSTWKSSGIFHLDPVDSRNH